MRSRSSSAKSTSRCDAAAEKHMLRIVDESGEDYLLARLAAGGEKGRAGGVGALRAC